LQEGLGILLDIFGMHLWTKVLAVCALFIVSADLFITAFTILYQRFWYDRVFRKRYDESYTPRCSIILPCKGIAKDLKENLRTFFNLDYRNYEIIFALESESDPAFPIIRDLVADHPAKASITIAGLATKCAQKNFNLLAAIKKAEDAEVYVFADADIGPKRLWLKELILPLSNPDVAVTTGFRWLKAIRGSTGEYVHTYINIFLYVLLTFINFFCGTFLWGGSMAIRKKDFESLKVADFWSTAVVDDNSLSKIIMKNSLRSVVVPACITTSDDLIVSVGQGINWFTRQIMFLKSYEKAVWFFGVLPLVLCATILFLWFPVALILGGGFTSKFFNLGGGASLVFLIGELMTVSLYPLLGSMPKFHRFLALQPFLRSTHIISSLRTIYTNKIVWSGVKYHLTFSGKVSRVERMVPKEKKPC
jgi:cellulose synthase/poly-beta-1,6-N-acetylglucosamine synthase-like glycosyltransferase